MLLQRWETTLPQRLPNVVTTLSQCWHVGCFLPRVTSWIGLRVFHVVIISSHMSSMAHFPSTTLRNWRYLTWVMAFSMWLRIIYTQSSLMKSLVIRTEVLLMEEKIQILIIAIGYMLHELGIFLETCWLVLYRKLVV